MKKIIKLILAVLIALFMIFFACYFLKSINKISLDCAVIDNKNGNIAISYYHKSYTYIQVFDTQGIEIYNGRFDNSGKGINSMAFDETGNLLLELNMKNYDIEISIEEKYFSRIEKSNVFKDSYWYNTWKKENGEYVIECNGIKYCYDYLSFFEYIRANPSENMYIIDDKGECYIIWSN